MPHARHDPRSPSREIRRTPTGNHRHPHLFFTVNTMPNHLPNQKRQQPMTFEASTCGQCSLCLCKLPAFARCAGPLRLLRHRHCHTEKQSSSAGLLGARKILFASSREQHIRASDLAHAYRARCLLFGRWSVKPAETSRCQQALISSIFANFRSNNTNL